MLNTQRRMIFKLALLMEIISDGVWRAYALPLGIIVSVLATVDIV